MVRKVLTAGMLKDALKNANDDMQIVIEDSNTGYRELAKSSVFLKYEKNDVILYF